MIVGQLYKLGLDEILRRCVLPHEQGQILVEGHVGVDGGQYGGHTTSKNVLPIRIWWPTLHNDVTNYVKTCDVFQRMGKLSRRDEMPLVPQVTLQPFDKWVVDFVGPINPPGKRTSAWYVIIVIDYLTRWVEATPIVDCKTAIAARFLFDKTITRFGCPRILMSNHGSHFINRTVNALT